MYSQISLSIQIVPFIFLIKRNRLVKQTVHRFTVTIKKDSIAGQTNRALQYELLLRQFLYLDRHRFLTRLETEDRYE